MKFENALQPDVKNLKNVFGKDFHGKTLLKVPRLVTSGYLMDDPEWSSNPHVHDFTELIFCCLLYTSLGNCAFHDLQNTVHTYLGGRVEIYGDNPKTDYSGNSVGAYTYWNGLVMLCLLYTSALPQRSNAHFSISLL